MLEEYLTREMCRWVNLYRDSVTDVTLIGGENMYMSVGGSIVDTDCYVSYDALGGIVSSLCKGSIYANQPTLKKGYITLENGFRVGMTGTAVTDEEGRITHLRSISAVNIRISRVVSGASEKIIRNIYNGNKIYNTLIIAPPGAGKTTVLRDIAVQLGKNFRVGIADERCEIMPMQVAYKHVFVMRGAKKHDGMQSMLRSMSPQVIATDEIGTKEDEEAILSLVNAGVKIICTAHGYSEEDVLRRNVLRRLVEEKIFETIIVLSKKSGPGTVEKIIHTKENGNG